MIQKLLALSLINAAILPCAAGALCLLAALFFPEVHSDNRRHSEGICQRIMDVDPWKASLLTDDLNPGKYYDAPKHRETRRLMISLMQSVAREGAIP